MGRGGGAKGRLGVFQKNIQFGKSSHPLGEGCQKKLAKKYGLLLNQGGGGVSKGNKKTLLLFWKSIFFRKHVEFFWDPKSGHLAEREGKTSPQAERHQPSLLFTSLAISTTLDFITK